MTDIAYDIHENSHYFIQVGKSVHNDNSVDCYQIVNKKYGVVEAEFTVLPRAIDVADELEKDLLDASPIDIPTTGGGNVLNS